tara:strand:+ start:6379 stop:7536 length:1158 start_codon:yes stop_codon:yes gene_type:complete
LNIKIFYKIKDLFWINSLSVLLFLFYFSEGYGKFFIGFYDERPHSVKAIKLIVLLLLFLCLFKSSKFLFQLFLIITVFIIGQLFIIPNFTLPILIILSKYLFPILLFTYYNKLKLSSNAFYRLMQVFELIIIINGIFILLGFIFDIQIFRTYSGSRFGYNGLLITSATSSYFYIISLLYYLIKKKEFFIYTPKVYFLILTALLVGTRSIYLSVFCILFYYFIFYSKTKYKNLGFLTILLCGFYSIYFTLFKWEIFNKILERESLITAVLSYRDKLLLDKMIPFIQENWTIGNYFFGGINDPHTRSQLALFDLFYFFGLTGMLLYLWSYLTNYLKFDFKKNIIFSLLLLGIIVFISGNFFFNASIPIYLLILREMIIHTQRENKMN